MNKYVTQNPTVRKTDLIVFKINKEMDSNIKQIVKLGYFYIKLILEMQFLSSD